MESYPIAAHRNKNTLNKLDLEPGMMLVSNFGSIVLLFLKHLDNNCLLWLETCYNRGQIVSSEITVYSTDVALRWHHPITKEKKTSNL